MGVPDPSIKEGWGPSFLVLHAMHLCALQGHRDRLLRNISEGAKTQGGHEELNSFLSLQPMLHVGVEPGSAITKLAYNRVLFS